MDNIDYSKTLQLPLTDFPMRGNLPQAEPNMQEWWSEIDIYNQVRAHRQGKEKFILHDGPPFANGDIHIGHALNKVLKDIIVRYKTMQGFDAPYVPGWDTHGLPIEQAIANRDKVDRKTMSVQQFREYCREYAEQFIEKQKTQFKRLGVRADWDNPYVTLQPTYEAQQIRVFGEMVKRGCIYKGLKPVYWSPSSESALAEAEIEYMEKTSHSIYVAFPLKDGKGVLAEESTSIVIWTTTPWTLPANLGISLHPEFVYAVVQRGDAKYVIAEGLLEQVRAELGWTVDDTPVIATFKGEQLDGAVCHHPFYERDSLVMVGEHVTLEAGTGCVHTAPGHGEDDFIIGKRYGLEVLCPVDDQGKFTAEAPGYEGIYYEKANAAIIERLQNDRRLLHESKFQHQYPHDWRTKKPVIFRATEQWFASIDAFRAEMLEAIKTVKWTPHWGEVRLHNMIADRGDWCISRQRSWGVPIPIMYCRHCQQPLVNEQTIEHVAKLFEQEGSAAWYVRAERELLPEGTTCGACGHSEFRKETDIMDVWFDSGASHVCVLETRPELQWPADLYLEGSDQYRGWYNSSLITGVAVRGQSPYKGVLSHGFVLDGEGRKMSKSLGNTVDPVKTCNTLGADILRLWVSSVDYQADVRISDNILTQITEVYRKIRNTLRYLLGNVHGFEPARDAIAVDQLGELDRYIMARLQRMTERVLKAYENYEFHVVYQTIHHFCAVELSAFYLDIIKDRLYAEAATGVARRAAQTVLYAILRNITALIAPVLPHTADEVWRYIPGVETISVQLSDMPVVESNLFADALEEKWSQLIEIRDEVLKALEEARKSKLIGNSLAAAVHLYPTNTQSNLLSSFDDLEKIMIVSAVQLHPPTDREVLAVEVVVAEGEKCERCWNVTKDVGSHPNHKTCCARCADVVELELE